MKLLLVLLLCAFAAAAPNGVHVVESFQLADYQSESTENRNILVNALVRQLFAYLRHIINNGSAIFGIPPLDPLELDHFHVAVPAGLINLDLDLKNILVAGLGAFVVHKSDLNLRDMTFDLDISIPTLDIRADAYDLVGDLFTAIPLYGKGKAWFVADAFRFQAKLILKQSDDGKSILVKRVDEPSFIVPSIKSDLTGVIGGGDIDGIVNAMIDEVLVDYVHRFRGAIAQMVASVAPAALNPVLGQLDTWRFIAPLIPRS